MNFKVRELPMLDKTRCTGCGDCVRICPTNCLEHRALLVWLPRPADCIACEVCVLICPEKALQMAEWTPA